MYSTMLSVCSLVVTGTLAKEPESGDHDDRLERSLPEQMDVRIRQLLALVDLARSYKNNALYRAYLSFFCILL